MLRKLLVVVLFLNFTLTHGQETEVKDFIDIDLSWGGYYASISKDSNEISIFRLLDFNRDAYHIALYKEKFKAIPSEKNLRLLTPLVGHAPIDSRALLNNKSVVLITSKQLSEEDLVGYMYYLEEFEVPTKEREKLSQSLISFGKEPPLPLRLYLVEGELQISQRN